MPEREIEHLRNLFHEQRHRRFGTRNPDRMQIPHWEWMVRSELTPYQVLEKLSIPLDTVNGPDWCFGPRYGSTITELADGRTIHVGGEYEDWYDPQFCIYNDVIVRGPDDEVEIYGYPASEFPPTDFHSATLIDHQIVLIGGLGYEDERQPKCTPVFALDTTTFRIERLNTTGDNPGWIFEHAARRGSTKRAVVISGGEVYVGTSQPEQFVRNSDLFELDLTSLRWRHLKGS